MFSPSDVAVAVEALTVYLSIGLVLGPLLAICLFEWLILPLMTFFVSKLK